MIILWLKQVANLKTKYNSFYQKSENSLTEGSIYQQGLQCGI